MGFRWLARLLGRSTEQENQETQASRRIEAERQRAADARSGESIAQSRNANGTSTEAQSLFFRQSLIDEFAITKFAAAGYEVSALDLDGRAGFVVLNVKSCRALLELIDSEPLAVFPSSYEGISEVVASVRPASATGKVYFSDWNGNAAEFFKKITDAVLLPHLACNVELCVPHGENRKAPADNDFHIYIWSSSNSSPGAHADHKTPATMFHIPVDCRDNSFSPSGKGVILQDERGNAVAEIVENSLYIFHDLCHNGSRNELGIFYRTLELAAKHFAFFPALEKRLAELYQETIDTTGEDSPRSSLKSSFDIQFKDSGERVENKYSKRIFTLLLEKILFPIQPTKFVVEYCAGQTREKSESRIFHVYLWSSALGQPLLNPPERIFGFSTSGSSGQGFLPSGQGYPIFDQNGSIVAELIGDQLYILFPIRVLTRHDECLMMLEILRSVRRGIEVCKERQETFAQEQNGAEQFSALDNLALSAVSSDASSTALDTLATALEDERKALRKRLKISARAEMSFAQLRLAPLKKLGQEFDALLELPQVTDIHFDKSELSITTKTLYCRNPETNILHEIGAFRISIPIDTGKPIRWHNLTRQVDGHKKGQNAPHIWNDGTACLGNTEQTFKQLRAKRDLAGATMVAIAFVESVNMGDSAGKHIVRWPVVREIK